MIEAHTSDQRAVPSAEYFSDFASAYNKEINGLLRQLDPDRLSQEIQSIANSFYARLLNRTDTAEILARLSTEEFEHLKARQIQHIHFVFSPDTTLQMHYQRALAVGRAHGMVGMGLPMLLEAYHLYRRGMTQFFNSPRLDGQQRANLIKALHKRLDLDLEAQIISYAQLENDAITLHTALDSAIQGASNLPDLLRQFLRTLGDFDGLVACIYMRPDVRGVIQIEAEGGREARSFVKGLQARSAQMVSTLAKAREGAEPAGRAWRTGKIQISNSYQQKDTEPQWRSEAKQYGFRSEAAIPFVDEAEQPFAVMNLYSSWPGFFGATVRTGMLRHIQQALGQAVLRFGRTEVVPAELRRSHIQHLEDGAVQMVYQPIVDLRTGKLKSVEALARLRNADGKLIPPDAFLAAFGSDSLLRLFRLGLEQVCQDFRTWSERSQALHLPVGLNLPPDGLTDNAYRDCIFETLSRWKLPASFLTLEMLETKETLDVSKRDKRIEEFREAGLKIAQDDLGSGHSSLLRMNKIAVDGVKIDQQLVRGAMDKPARALEFIHHLTQLAQESGMTVTVEGLEDDGLIEAAAILGADFGQGYGIARPMPAQDVLSWNRTWSMPVDPEHPHTALGALAGDLLWNRGLDALKNWPDLAANYIGKPSLVERYLDATGKSDPNISRLLERKRAVALQEPGSVRSAESRRELIDALSEVWLKLRG